MSLFRSFSVVSGGTLLSRILGLVRDVLFFATFGTSLFGEAFLLAFTIPNLFRRMLGEGTLSSAFIPVFSNLSGSLVPQWFLLNQVVSRLFLSLGFLSFCVICFSFFSYHSTLFQVYKWHVASYLNGVTFLYVIFICSSAILVAALNVKGSFGSGAVSPILLNLVMIGVLFAVGIAHELSFQSCAVFLSIGVVVAGFFQLLLPWMELKFRFGWQWKFDLSKSDEIKEVGSLFWVGIFGAAVAQINILISRFLAYSLEQEGAVTYLYMSARLVELPLGIFAIAISTILFPKLASAVSRKDQESYQSSFFLGLRSILMLTLPSAIGLFLVGDLVVNVLFQWKEFSAENTNMAYVVLRVVSWTIPLYAISTFLVKSYHSQKNMGVPLKAASLSLITNLIFSLLLMNTHGVLGLAWANVLAAIIQLFYLCFRNKNLSSYAVFSNTSLSLSKLVLASVFMFLAILYAKQIPLFSDQKWDAFFQLLFLIFTGVLSYFSVLYFLKFPLSFGKPLLSRLVRK